MEAIINQVHMLMSRAMQVHMLMNNKDMCIHIEATTKEIKK